ncbi:Hypothetical predicted protein [Pelobates cultripes]|uniref:Uncharacterized protein n=1 Tax=Pelobates cultripes TaxID=61616 RepID=A0AAD1T297_PELCU|nr:Hypothetical predicted protein [Pelobates cultripes]
MDTRSSEAEEPLTPLLAQSPPPDEADDDEDAFAVLARATPSPDLIPWEQRSQKMKILYYVDRIFLFLLGIFLIVLFGEVSYILHQTVPWIALYRRLKDYLLMQEESEEELDL